MYPKAGERARAYSSQGELIVSSKVKEKRSLVVQVKTFISLLLSLAWESKKPFYGFVLRDMTHVEP